MKDLSKRIANLSPAQLEQLTRRLGQKAGAASAPAAIRRRGDGRPAPLSFSQQRLWFLDQLEPGSPAYHIPVAVRMSGRLDRDALVRSLSEVVRRHEALRTSFVLEDGRPVQVVGEACEVALPLEDISHLPEGEREAESVRLSKAEARVPFDLGHGPLLRAKLLRLSAEEHVLLLTMHHIVSDGWSVGLLQREVAALYEAFAAGRPSPLAPLPVQYSDYAFWQRERLTGEAVERQLAYWREQLKGAPPVLELPTDRPRPAVQRYDGWSVPVCVEAEVAEELRRLSLREGATLFMTLLAAFDALLYRYSHQEDFSVGTPVAGRTRAETEGLIGFFVNTLVLRARLRPGMTFRELLAEVRATTLGANDHQEAPFERLVDELQPERDLSHSPLFQVMFAMQNTPNSEQSLSGLTLTPARSGLSAAKFDLELSLEEKDGRIVGWLQYNTDLYDEATARRMARHFEALLASAAADPDERISRLEMISVEEREQVLRGWNATGRDYPSGRRLHEWFEAQAALTPDRPALVFENETLTYAELNRRANQLAHYLRGRGVGPESLVGVLTERSVEMVVALYAVLKAGGAYVPFDPDYPQDRLAFMLEDAAVKVLLTQKRLAASVPAHGAEVFCLDEEWDAVACHGVENPPRLTDAAGAAYMIYTSGSTGRPKGVVNTHRGICNRLVWMQEAYQLTAADRVMQKTPFSFDVSVWEFFWPLMYGACLVVARPRGHQDSAYLAELVRAERITTMHFVPSMLQAFVEEEGLERKCATLRRVICSGEALPFELQERFHARLPATGLHNLYGPTEAAVDVTFWECERDSPRRVVPIGRPIANTQIYILDRETAPVPAGVAGELHIGGIGVARGYLNRPALTAEKFIPDPFSAEPGARLYRTGDLARHLADGEVEYLGRLDHQVKVRGFRIELGEIEAALARHPSVREAVVLAREDAPGMKRLVAYFVAEPQSAPTLAELRAHLKELLPEYMIPTAFVTLERMPLSPNGKVDRKALPAPDKSKLTAGTEFVAPRGANEETLAAIWAQVLRLERVGARDNFFELGGDSILSIQVVTKAQQAGIRLTPKMIFEHQTVAELAAAAGSAAPAAEAEQGSVTGSLPLTPIQRRFFEQEPLDPHHYNQAVLLNVGEPLDAAHVARAVGLLVEHHDALRLRFTHGDGGWRQEVAGVEGAAPFTHVDLSGLPAPDRRAAVERAAAVAQTELCLAAGPLLRVVYFTFGAGEPARLLVVIHHLAVDGVSWRVLLEDLGNLCAQLSRGESPALPAKTTSFKRWAELLAEYAQTSEARGDEDYWLGLARGEAGRLPVDNPSGANTAANVRAATARLDAETTSALLQQAPKAYRTQVNDLLLAALAEALREWAGAERVLVDVEGHGREELFEGADTSRTVGWFTSLFPVALEATGDEGATLKRVKEQLRAAPRRGLTYGLLKYLSSDAETAARLRGLPAAEIMFNYHGRLDRALEEDSLFAPAAESTGASQSPRQRRMHLIEIDGGVLDGRLTLNFQYSEEQYRPETVQRLAEAFGAALRRVVAHCLSEGAGGYTPSDFPLARLEQRDLDRVLGNAHGVEDLYPLSPMQQGMLFHSLYAPESGFYVYQLSCTLRGRLNVAAFERAWQQVVERHPALRSSFVWESLAEPLQLVRRHVAVQVEELDWSALRDGEREERLSSFLEEDRRRGFDLSQAPLMRLVLARAGEETYHFVWTHHHLLLDGWSLSLLWGEVFAAYEALARGVAPAFAPARPFRDYVAWLRRQDASRPEEFWRASLKGFNAPTPLAVDRPAPEAPAAGSPTGQQQARLSSEATARLQAFARSHHLTLNTLLQGAWALLLSRYSGERDVVFGATVSGRPPELDGVEEMIGLFINTLPVRAEVEPRAHLADWLKGLQGRQAELRQYEHSPLVEVQGWSEVPRGTPLFESILIFENYPIDPEAQKSDAALEVTDIRPAEKTTYPLTVTAAPGTELLLRVQYDCRRFDEGAAARLLGHLRTLLEAVPEHGRTPLAQLPLLSAEERAQQLLGWNSTAAEYPSEKCFQHLFEEQVARTPDRTALAYKGVRLTYRELNARANRLARHLRACGLTTEARAGLMLERTPHLLVAALAVLKAGGAYVPLDPAYPRDRLSLMAEDAGLSVLVSERSLLGQLPAHGARLVVVDAHAEEIALQDAEDLPRTDVTPEQVAYTIYTSGSTGRPKGVQVPHRALVNFLESMQERPGLCESDVLLAVTSLSFDIAALELYLPLLCGARVELASRDEATDAELLAHRLSESGATVMQATPSTWTMLVKAGWRSLGHVKVLCGGEALPEELASQLLAGGAELWNMYGPTETTIWSATEQVTRGRSITIGRPIANTQLYVVDESMQPAPVGVSGELLIGGDGLARGYLNRAALTAERFIPDPFSAEPGARLYRTGDVARWLADGRVEYVGRSDHQVKVRGFRIELGEIEAVLASHPSVREAVAVVREDVPGDKRIVAYLVGKEGPAAPAAELRAHLKEGLPEYMIPSNFVTLDALPLTPNGKVDRKALPAPAASAHEPGERGAAPRTPVEEVLAGIWSEVLGVGGVSTRDNFFELGGHSLLVAQVVSRVRAAFQVELPLRAIFESPTVSELAARIEGVMRTGVGSQSPPLARVGRDGRLPLSLAQRQLWFLEQLGPGGSAYNIPAAVRLTGALNVEALRLALSHVTARHESLRTVFVAEDGAPVQSIRDEAEVSLPLNDISRLPAESHEEEVARLADEESRAPFDLSRGPLLRAQLLRLSEEEHVLLLTMHHIVSDGWSMGLLVEELSRAYAAFASGTEPALPGLPVQYADYAAWQREWLEGEALDSQLAYWKQQLKGAPPVLELPTDRPRPAVQRFVGASTPVSIDAELTEQLRRLGRRQGVTLFMTLLAAFEAVLHYHSRLEEIVVGTDVAGRRHVETERLIGLFVNSLVLRTSLAGDPNFVELLGRVRRTTLEAYAHADVPFGKLVEELQPERSLAHMPLFQVAFSFQNYLGEAPEVPGLRVSNVEVESRTAKFDMVLNLSETKGGIVGAWRYNTDLFNAATAERLVECFTKLLRHAAAAPEEKLSVLVHLLSEADRRRLAEKEQAYEKRLAGKLTGIRRRAAREVAAEA
ncbi:MAG: amino acid adenylation domain-containing protein [Acidobacteria bacterium]|nr:amino acid adenylation domain-containing protein [Acidobacteriota bacterium]